MNAWILFGLYEIGLTCLLFFAPLDTQGRVIMLGLIFTVAAIAAATERIIAAVEAICEPS